MITASDAPDVCWCDAPARLELGNDEVHVWRVMLNVTEPVLETYRSILSGEERAKADKFYFGRDRDHSIAARAVLRMILSRYLDVKPAHLRFSFNRFGKPALTGELTSAALHFNVSHSGELALVAVTQGQEIGVDVEHIRDNLASEEIAGRFFSRREVAMLRALPPEMRTRGFFNCWTRKEAYIKGRGKGLSLPLDKFDVSLSPGEPAALLSVREIELEASRWCLRELTVGPCYAAAIAVRGHDWQLKCWQWELIAAHS